MVYGDVVRGTFLDRPNRFIAHVRIGDKEETVHVKNTGRCRELLWRGAEVWLNRAERSERKTAFDLIAVRKSNGLLVNIDSQAPNRVMEEWLAGQSFSRVQREVIFGKSRLDFFLEKGTEKTFLEVKGCTLEKDGIGYFPDAPSIRAVKHLRELTAAVEEGFGAAVGFVIQMDSVTQVYPNNETHPAFGEALTEAKSRGVRILRFPCHVEPNRLEITDCLADD